MAHAEMLWIRCQPVLSLHNVTFCLSTVHAFLRIVVINTYIIFVIIRKKCYAF